MAYRSRLQSASDSMELMRVWRGEAIGSCSTLALFARTVPASSCVLDLVQNGGGYVVVLGGWVEARLFMSAAKSCGGSGRSREGVIAAHKLPTAVLELLLEMGGEG